MFSPSWPLLDAKIGDGWSVSAPLYFIGTEQEARILLLPKNPDEDRRPRAPVPHPEWDGFRHSRKAVGNSPVLHEHRVLWPKTLAGISPPPYTCPKSLTVSLW